jgi:hypothetical protein
MKASITARYEPCRCGCKGTDPWHASRFVRVLTNVETHEPKEVQTRTGKRVVDQTATAKFPWGHSLVHKDVRFQWLWYLGETI